MDWSAAILTVLYAIYNEVGKIVTILKHGTTQ